MRNQYLGNYKREEKPLRVLTGGVKTKCWVQVDHLMQLCVKSIYKYYRQASSINIRYIYVVSKTVVVRQQVVSILFWYSMYALYITEHHYMYMVFLHLQWIVYYYCIYVLNFNIFMYQYWFKLCILKEVSYVMLLNLKKSVNNWKPMK